jgi:hypothetical protein
VKILALVVTLPIVSVMTSSSSFAAPLTLSAGDSVSLASDPNGELENPLTNAVLIEVTSSNLDLFQCGNVVGATATSVDLGAASGGSTVGGRIESYANGANATNFAYNPSSTYSNWCVGPTVVPYYFKGVDEIQLTFPGGVTAWALIIGPNAFIVAGESTGSTEVDSGGDASEAEVALVEAETAARRAIALAKAKTDLNTLFTTNTSANLQQFLDAGYGVRNSIVAANASAAILKLPVADRDNSDKINQIIKVENFIDRVSVSDTRSSVKSSELISFGLLPADSAYKHSVVQGLASYPEGSLNTMAKIESAIKEQIEKAEAPKRLLAEIKARIAARKR